MADLKAASMADVMAALLVAQLENLLVENLAAMLDVPLGQQSADLTDGLKVGWLAAQLAVPMADRTAGQKAAKMGLVMAVRLAANSDDLKVVPSAGVKASKSAGSMVDE